MIPEVKVMGIYYIPGRGTILTADRRDHDYELMDFRRGGSFLAMGKGWEVVALECFRRGDFGVGPVIGIVVKEVEHGL